MFNKKIKADVIAQIHNEFNSAGDKILDANKKFVDEKKLDKAKRLKAVGFFGVSEVVEIDNMVMSQQLSSLIEGYLVRYPNNKFITEKQVEKICSKYNLVCAPIDRYIGFVPDVKLKSIEAFRTYFGHSDKREQIAESVDWWSIADNKIKGEIEHEFGGKIPVGCIVGSSNTKWLQKKNGEKFSENVWVRSYKTVDTDSLFICAPQREMKLSGLKKVGSLFARVIVKHFPDPVVLQPVNGGYLIVTAWGDEASDEIVVNEKMN